METQNPLASAYEREKKARLRAEELLENKTREIYQINVQLQEQAEALARSNEELTQFAFIASHDLKEPLRKIKTFSNFLRDEYNEKLEGDGRDYLQRMNNAVDRMDALIEGLLYYSRITRNVEPYVKIDLNSMLKDVINDLSMRLEDTHGKVEIKNTLCVIEADLTQMRQLFQNLISNALKFHQEGKPPVVTLSSKTENGVCEIIIQDNGIGFENKYADKIFGIFQRLHGQSEYEGYGIGLAVCKRIVERHKGSIAVKSEPQKGTVFIINMPVAKGE